MPVIKKLSQWVNLGARACLYQKLLLDAELAACQLSTGASRDAVHLYNQAIDAAANAGIRHHEALANELACEFLANNSATRRASSYLSRALHLYSEWQAHAKVQELMGRHSELMDLMSSPFHAQQEGQTVVSMPPIIGGIDIPPRDEPMPGTSS